MRFNSLLKNLLQTFQLVVAHLFLSDTGREDVLDLSKELHHAVQWLH